MILKESKRRVLYLFILLQLHLLKGQTFDTICEQQKLVLSNLERYHISPIAINQKTTLDILDLFLQQTDPQCILFLKSDIKELEILVKDIPEKEVFCELIYSSSRIIQKRLVQIDSILSLIELKAFDLQGKDSVTLIPNNKTNFYSNDPQQLKKRLEKRVKYNCIDNLLKTLKPEESIDDLKLQQFLSQENTARKKAIARERKYFSNIKTSNSLNQQLADNMSNAIARRFDPHSEYFNSGAMENFSAALSTEEFSFGFIAGLNDENEISIKELIPGGSAWNSNLLHENDVILSYQFSHEKKIDLTEIDIVEFYTGFTSSPSKTVQLIVRKKDNQVIEVNLIKTKIHSTENTINSFILNGGSEKIGYIPLPSFYSNNESDHSLGCANDVAKEIIKLKKENISGLILDLRYNGGGSMREAMSLAGIFIDEGPVAIFKEKEGKPYLLKDLNRGSIYDGPLILLINTGSASASEFLTATLQDYKRAIVVGSSTFGKGTAQNIVEIDTIDYASGKKNKPKLSLGYLKITEGKFYRITSKSHQGKGIEPDIHIPDIMEKLAQKEAEYPYFLPCDSVQKKVSYTANNFSLIDLIKEKSKARIDTNNQFKLIVKLGDSLNITHKAEHKLALTPKSIYAYKKKQQLLNERIENVLNIENNKNFTIENNAYTNQLILIDEYQKKINTEFQNELISDFILNETFLIFKDINNQKQ